MPTETPVLAIDGPSGSGKGTVSRMLARRLGWRLLDSGALYRLAALAGKQAGLGPDDQAGHARLARLLDIRFEAEPDGAERIVLAGEAVTDLVRSETAGMGASRVAAWPPLRAALLDRQRDFARRATAVVEVDSGHHPFLSQPTRVRDLIVSLRTS